MAASTAKAAVIRHRTLMVRCYPVIACDLV